VRHKTAEGVRNIELDDSTLDLVAFVCSSRRETCCSPSKQVIPPPSRCDVNIFRLLRTNEWHIHARAILPVLPCKRESSTVVRGRIHHASGGRKLSASTIKKGPTEADEPF